MSQIAILGQLTNHEYATINSTSNTAITINGIPIDVEGSTNILHNCETYPLIPGIDVFNKARQSFVSINGKNILTINDIGTACGSKITYIKDNISLQNFIYIN